MPYVSPPVGTYDVDSPITDEFLDTLVGNADWLKALLESHAHSGADGSVAIEIGSNAVRNGSFESGTTNWTLTQYTGGTIATTTAHDMDGATALSIASSVLANGGGDAVSAPIACSGQVGLLVKAMVKASVANVSCAIKVQWLDDAQAQISETTVYSATSTPTTMLPVAELVSSPATARYYRIRLIGGVPATGSATGTIYFDGIFANPLNDLAVPGSTVRFADAAAKQSSGAAMTEVINVWIPVGGIYRVSFQLRGTGTPGLYTGYGRIYIDGVAAGTLQSQISATYVTKTEDIYVPPGSTLQLFLQTSDITQPGQSSNFTISTANKLTGRPFALAIGDR
jgi:hypothetical protein